MYTLHAIEASVRIMPVLIVFGYICGTLLCAMLYSVKKDPPGEYFAVQAVIVFIMSVAFYFLWPYPPAPRNEPVRATLMDETYMLREKSGKHSYSDNSYLMYMTPDGPVSFRRNQGQVYPKEAILYKN